MGEPLPTAPQAATGPARAMPAQACQVMAGEISRVMAEEISHLVRAEPEGPDRARTNRSYRQNG
jgi:hypothetical protein